MFSYLKEAHEQLPAAELDPLRDWFNQHLDAPDLLTNERFWFCAEAKEYILRARRLAVILGDLGIPIVERRLEGFLAR